MHSFGNMKGVKKFVAALLVFVVMVFAASPFAEAQRRHHRSFWKKHRDKLTVAGSTLGGAAIGSLVGGKKGALIGAGAGAGSGALYTYKIRKRHRHRHRY